ncbi:MAG: 3-hexulose-6-phosphate synthase [Methanomassiliicoccales archaeon]
MSAVLQVALDMMHLKRALEIGREAVEGGADWVEAGTPLIKSEGALAIRELRKAFPTLTLVADMKVMDVGAFEVEIAAKAGADIVTVLALADDATISESVLTARKYGAKVMVDLINVANKLERAKEVEKLGAELVCLHVGVDEQMHGRTSPLQSVREIAASLRIPVAVAGGITQFTAKDYVEAGASVIIVGGSIIKAENVREAAKAVKRAMLTGQVGAQEISRKYGKEELFQAFTKVSTPNIADAQHKRGVILGLVPHLRAGQKLVGRALTVQTAKGDWAKPVEAIDRASPGDVLVIDAGGSDVAVWGELASLSAQGKGITGVVVDGAVRDMDVIREIGFPCFCRYVVPHAGEPKGHGGIGLEIMCGGQLVRTGDWIIGDESGLVVVPQESAVEVANRALDVLERENRIREEIRRGGTLSSVLELEKWEQVR